MILLTESTKITVRDLCGLKKNDRISKNSFGSYYMDTLKHVDIFCDGACSGNPGPGGWGSILRYKGHDMELSGGAAQTTNNRMELTAVIEALRQLHEKCDVTINTDSQYVVNGIEKGWAKGWKKNNWIKPDKKPALNPELWDALLAELAKHNYRFHWIKGHAGHAENERCDALAVAQSKNYSQGG